MSGFDDLNEELSRQGGSYIKMNKTDCAPLDGRVVDVEVRVKQYEGTVLEDKNGNPRKEWVFTVDSDNDEQGTVKIALGESGQITVKDFMKKLGEKEGRKVIIQRGGRVHFHVVKDSVQGKKQAEIAFKYEEPKATTVDDDDEPPF
jgi:hypothetical protein